MYIVPMTIGDVLISTIFIAVREILYKIIFSKL